jgi:hypothetical protein
VADAEMGQHRATSESIAAKETISPAILAKRFPQFNRHAQQPPKLTRVSNERPKSERRSSSWHARIDAAGIADDDVGLQRDPTRTVVCLAAHPLEEHLRTQAAKRF